MRCRTLLCLCLAGLLFGGCNAIPRPVEDEETPGVDVTPVRIEGWTAGIEDIPVSTSDWVSLEAPAFRFRLRHPPGWKVTQTVAPDGESRMYSFTAASHAREVLAERGMEPSTGGVVILRVFLGDDDRLPACRGEPHEIAGARVPICWEFRSGSRYIVAGQFGHVYQRGPLAVHMFLVNPFDLTDEAVLYRVVRSMHFY